jgi:uridine kinase
MTREEMVTAACALLQARRTGARLFVAIDGAGGAGKSTLAHGIEAAFAGCVSIVRCDDFYRPLHDAQLSSEEAYERYFDWRRLRDEALLPLRDGQPAKYQRHDWTSDRLAESIEVEPHEIVIIEGVFSMRPELHALMDLTILIETPRDERIRRMTSRTQPSTSWMDQWLAAEDWYLANVAPHRSADLILAGI